MRFLISFVNSGKDQCLGLLNLDPKTMEHELKFWENPTTVRSISGICITPNAIVMGAEIEAETTPTPALLILDFYFKVIQVWKCQSIIAPHDIVWYNGECLVASPGNNSICGVMLQSNGRVAREYVYYSNNPESWDISHLNSLTTGNNGSIYFSVFGEKDKNLSRWSGQKEGKIYKLWRDKNASVHIDELTGTYIGRIAHPHSLTYASDINGLYFCESNKFIVRNLFDQLFSVKLDGYTRGIEYDEENLYVGISASRNVSKSTGEMNEDVIEGIDPGLAVMNRDIHKELNLRTISFKDYGVKEIYDIVRF